MPDSLCFFIIDTLYNVQMNYVLYSFFFRYLDNNNITEVSKGWLYGLSALQHLYVHAIS